MDHALDAAALDDLAARLFRAFEAYDLDTVGSMLAPDAVLARNGVGAGWDRMRPAIEAGREILGQHRYTDVRRVVGADAVVEEHRVRSTTPKGVELDLAVCVVIRVDGAGLITRLDEYVDMTPLG